MPNLFISLYVPPPVRLTCSCCPISMELMLWVCDGEIQSSGDRFVENQLEVGAQLQSQHTVPRTEG